MKGKCKNFPLFFCLFSKIFKKPIDKLYRRLYNIIKKGKQKPENKEEQKMTKYMETKAKKIYAGINKDIQSKINACIELYAEANVINDESKATEWRSRIAGVLDCLCTLKIISINEMILLNEYAIKQAWKKTEEMQKGVA